MRVQGTRQSILQEGIYTYILVKDNLTNWVLDLQLITHHVQYKLRLQDHTHLYYIREQETKQETEWTAYPTY